MLRDKYGCYDIRQMWIEAYDAKGAKGRSSYFCRCELRAYHDGSERVMKGRPCYLLDLPQASLALHAFDAAQRELMAMSKPPRR